MCTILEESPFVTDHVGACLPYIQQWVADVVLSIVDMREIVEIFLADQSLVPDGAERRVEAFGGSIASHNRNWSGLKLVLRCWEKANMLCSSSYSLVQSHWLAVPSQNVFAYLRSYGK